MPLVCLRYELNTTGKGRKFGLFPLFGGYFSRIIPLGGICQQRRNTTPLEESIGLWNLSFQNLSVLRLVGNGRSEQGAE